MGVRFNLQQTEFGIPFTEAYAKIDSYNGNNQVVHYTVAVYATKETRDNNSSRIALLHYVCPFPEVLNYSNILEGLYVQLKLQPNFENAEDC
jgi:hypothetical protein